MNDNNKLEGEELPRGFAPSSVEVLVKVYQD